MMSSGGGRRNSTTHSVGSSVGSFQTDEDGSEMGHLSVSVSELNQLRQHVRNMRTNMTGKNKNNSQGGKNLAPAGGGDTNSVLEEVDIAAANGGGGASVCGSTAGGLVVSDEVMTPEQRKRMFRLSIIGNIMFALGALLYICVAHGDLQWAQDIQGIPTNVLDADDDAIWREWQAGQSASPPEQPPQPSARRLRLHGSTNGHRILSQDINDMLWRDLPTDIQLALMVLGHNARTWNKGMTSSLEETRWEKLTDEQQDAAKIIGYSKQEWNQQLDDEEKAWEKTEAAYGLSNTATGADDDLSGRRDDDRGDPGDDRYQDDRYEDEDEEDDEVAEDDRYRYQGQRPEDDEVLEDDRYEDQDEDDRYEDEEDDEVAEDDRYRYQDQRPEDDEVPEYDDQYPDDDKAVTAGEVFNQYKESQGGNDLSSTGEVTPRPTPTPAPKTPSPTTTPPVAAAEDTASKDEPKYTIDGDEIKPEEQEPQEEKETRAPEVPADPTSPEDLMIWGDYNWEDLPDAIKKAFEILGYNEELWNTGGTAFTEDLYWEDLTKAQKRQAGVLGYNQKLWDEANDGNYDITSGQQDDDEEGSKEDNGEEDDDGEFEDSADGSGTDDELVRQGVVPKDDTEMEAVTLFFAALCFMIAGVMNWIRERQVFHMWMVQGGVFGILSALTMGFSSFASLLLQTVSVHCFMLQSCFMLQLRKTIRPVEGLELFSHALWAADILFAAGAFIQVVMVYWLHGDEDAYYDVGLGYGEVFAAWCWFFTAAIYTMNTLAMANKRMHEDNRTRTLTITRQHPNGETYTIRPAAIQLRKEQQQNNEPPCHNVVLT